MAFWQCLLIVSVLSYTAVLCQKKAGDNRTCVPGDVSCDGGSTCLPSRWFCDGEEDCADGSDEHNCTNNVGQRTCGPGDVLCDVSSMCFPSRWLCDGDRDCADGSDEHNCTSRAATCPSDTFYCGDDSIACIPLAWRCDGTPECPSGVDEQNCTRKVMCDSTQFRCDDQSCVDSTQRCDGAKDCFNGRDEQNCIHHNVPVILAERHNIHMVTLYLDTSKAVSRLIFPENRNSSIVGIDYDYVEGYVFWTDSERNAIYSARFLNSSSSLTDVRAILTTDIRRSDGLAVDWINKLVYWTDTGRDEISVSNYNGTQRKVLVNTDLDEPRAIVVDPLLGWMYWTDWGIRAKIERAGMDGTRRETIVTTDLTWPNGLTLDYKDRRLYWVDSKSKTVESARKDGSDRKILNKGDVNHGFGITSSELYVFITSWMDRGVVKVSKADGVATLFTGEPEDAIRYPMGLKVYSDTVQKPRPSICNSNKFQCEYLCLPGPSQSQDSAAEYTCACPDGDTCGDTTTTDASTTNRQTTITPRTTSMPPTVSTTTVPSSTDLVRTEISTAERTTTVAPPQTTQVTNQVTLSDTTVTPEGTTDAGPTTRADIICEDNRISIHVPADLLPTGREVTWNDPSCVVTNNGTHLVGTIGLDSCGTVVHFNDTHVVFENDLVSESTNGTNAIDFGLNSVIPVQCVYPRRQEVSTSFLPVAGHARFYEKGMGHLQVQMRHARDVTFDETYDVGPVAHQVTLNKPVYLKLTLGVVNQTISDISINVDRCFATPSSSLLDSELQELTDNGCPASPSVMVYPSPGSEVHFSFRAFRFTGHPNNPVYVHCQVFVCSTSNSDCIPGCNNNGRKRRAAVGGPNTHLVSSGPYRLSSDQAAGSSSALVAVTGLCVFLAVAATVFGVLAWRGRKRLAVHYKEFT